MSLRRELQRRRVCSKLRFTAPVAGVRHETVPAMKGIDELDLLDPDCAVVVARRDDAGVDLRIVPLP